MQESWQLALWTSLECGDMLDRMLSMGQQSRRISVMKVIVAINVAIFFIEALLPLSVRVGLESTFGLSMHGIANGMLWQFFTYQFLHASLFHLFVNMVGLWFAGRILENLVGTIRFLLLYLLCGATGGVFQLLFSPGPVLLGASGSVCGVITAFCALFPEMQITALIFFILPINLRAKWLGIAIVGVSLFFSITGLGGNISHEAHLGGALAGYAFVWLGRRQRFKILPSR